MLDVVLFVDDEALRPRIDVALLVACVVDTRDVTYEVDVDVTTMFVLPTKLVWLILA